MNYSFKEKLIPRVIFLAICIIIVPAFLLFPADRGRGVEVFGDVYGNLLPFFVIWGILTFTPKFYFKVLAGIAASIIYLFLFPCKGEGCLALPLFIVALIISYIILSWIFDEVLSFFSGKIKFLVVILSVFLALSVIILLYFGYSIYEKNKTWEENGILFTKIRNQIIDKNISADALLKECDEFKKNPSLVSSKSMEYVTDSWINNCKIAAKDIGTFGEVRDIRVLQEFSIENNFKK